MRHGAAYVGTTGTAAPRVISWTTLSRLGTIRRKSAKRWFVDLRVEAGVRIYSDRGEPFTTKEEAQRFLTILRGRLRKTNQTLEQVIEECLPDTSKRHTVQRYVADWVDVKEREARDGTVSPEYVRNLRGYAKAGGHFSYLSDLSIHELDFKTIQRWRFWLQEHRGLKNPRYVASVMQHFHGFMSWLRDCGEIAIIPRFNYPKRPVHKPKILSMRAQAAILEEIPEEGRGVFLACCLGIRPAEARALDAADYEDGWLTVSKSYAGPTLKSPIREGDKRDDFKRIPLFGNDGASPAMEWIERHVVGQRIGKAPMFIQPTTGNRWTAHTLRKWWKRAADQAGIETGPFYEASKHSFATDMQRRGVPERLMQRYLGHTSRSSTRRYAQLADEALVDVLSSSGEVHSLPDRKPESDQR